MDEKYLFAIFHGKISFLAFKKHILQTFKIVNGGPKMVIFQNDTNSFVKMVV